MRTAVTGGSAFMGSHQVMSLRGGRRVNILGINIYHGDASAAILCDGQLLIAAEIYRNSLVSRKNLVKREGRRS